MQLKTSVRNLVEFLLRSGDIDNRHTSSAEGAMVEGGRIHRMIQRRMGADYRAEVALRYVYPVRGAETAQQDPEGETEEGPEGAAMYDIIIEGRADGIITEAEGFTIDEIKGTYRDVGRMAEPVAVHLAQAKCYACMYALDRLAEKEKKRAGIVRRDGEIAVKEYEDTIRVRMTYCNMDTEEIRYFHFEYTWKELEAWFFDLISQYRKWADMEFEWKEKRRESIRRLCFPFPYRKGQKELAADVYRTICHRRKLFLEAPTGVGKTISTVFPAVKAIGEGKADKIFYLTAKSVARTVADEAFSLLRGRGLSFKTVLLTARDKICFLEEAACNPQACPYAEGHFDRINEALYDILTHEVNYSRETIEDYAKKHRVCPFEMGLDISLFCDGIICDYNYVFDPHVYLRRFFAENGRNEYLFLVDEAHNLVERGREMYSASLWKEDFLELKRKMKAIDGRISRQLDKCNRELLVFKRMYGAAAVGPGRQPATGGQESPEGRQPATGGQERPERWQPATGGQERPERRLTATVRQERPERRQPATVGAGWRVVESLSSFTMALTKLHASLGDFLEEHEERADFDGRKELLEFYFAVSHFLEIYELMDENYVAYTKPEEDGRFLLRLFCVNPSVNLKGCMARACSSILFSATLLPIQYYKKLLGGEPEDYEVYALSAFDRNRCGVFTGGDVTTRYSRRGEKEYERIARYIYETVKNRYGNYMIFFPSYHFLRQVYDIYTARFWDRDTQECILQEGHMSEQAREAFLARFSVNESCDFTKIIQMEVELEEDRSLLGFCVMGGIFSEGIDLKKDSLIGAVVVGTGIPQVCAEREILKQYFDGEDGNGFDYAYRFPGMNKVLQAAGRVIRTAEDVGIVVLLDERFGDPSYRRLFPREWENREKVSVDRISKRIERFWDEWL